MMRPPVRRYTALLDKPNTVRDFFWRSGGGMPLLLGVREPCSRLSGGKPCFAPPRSEAWLPTPKRQHGWRTPRLRPGMLQIYSGQYWDQPAVAPALRPIAPGRGLKAGFSRREPVARPIHGRAEVGA